MTKLAPYMKAVVAIVGAVVTAVLTQFPDNDTVQQWGPIVSALLTAVSVYAVPNKAPEPDEGGSADVVIIFYLLGIVFFVVATLNLLGVGTRGLFG